MLICAAGLGRQGRGCPSYPPVALGTVNGANYAYVMVGEPVVFDGSQSYDPDNPAPQTAGIVSWYWDFRDGQKGYFPASVSHSFAAPGIYPVDLEVTDDEGSKDSLNSPLTVIAFRLRLSGELWWFNGENAANYSELVALEAQGTTDGTFEWSVTCNAHMVNLNNGGADADYILAEDDNDVLVKSTARSEAQQDVFILCRYEDWPLDEKQLTVWAPAQFLRLQAFDLHLPVGPGYCSQIVYRVRDQFWLYLPLHVEVNEKFTSEDETDRGAQGDDWTWGPEGGALVDPLQWADTIMFSDPTASNPVPQHPMQPLGNQKVDHKFGDWYCGSTTPGKGVKVLPNCKWQRYRDHAMHE